MTRLSVTLSKLRKYVDEQGGYELIEDNGNISLTFVPSFPEALEKSEGQSPRIIMTGGLKDGIVEFEMVQVEEDDKTTSKDRDVAELAYGSWLEYIEENY